MKQFYFFLVAWLMAASLLAQTPANDDCNAPINLGIAPNCTSDVYTNVNATASDIGSNNVPTCFGGGTPGNDVWFFFTCPSAPLDFRVELTGTGANPITGTQLAVYRGDCSVDGLAELDCIAAPQGQSDLFLDLEALTPGAIYFIRVSDFAPGGNSNPGTFNLCVNEIPPVVTIDQGSSSLCEGTLYDTGGPDGDYSGNEDHTFTICPSTPAACIDFTLEYFSLDAGPTNLPGSPGNDVLSFFDGANTSAPLLAQINGFSNPFGTDGGGGVCFRVQAGSGCLTIQFQSDATVEFEGFKGLWTCSSKVCETIDPIEVETAVNNTDIVDAILAPGTTVTITDIKCNTGAYGTFGFASDNNDLGLRKGLLLTSGSVDNVPGPNNQDDATFAQLTAGDPDLDYLSTLQGSTVTSEDACVVEMDVFVASDELTFEYIFGSEEYPEYANDVFNDIFAFLASGPGIAGDPNLGGAQNIAVLPGTATPVQINSVNNVINWEYYRNNGVWEGSTLQYDGFTSDFLGVKKSLTARVDVIPCNTYHLKLAIADRFDPLFDSGVFISEVRGGAPNLAVEFASGLDYFIESCTGDQDQLVISLSQTKPNPVSYTITVGGSATQGTDYLLNIPSVITFQPGDSVLTFPIVPLLDAEAEGVETITISLSNDFGCGSVVFQTLTIELRDDAEVLINGGADTVYVCQGGTAQLEASGALNYVWTPTLAVSDPNVPNPTITPSQDVMLQVIGSVGNCSDTAKVFVKMISTPTLMITSDAAPNICQGDTLQLHAITNAGLQGVTWTPKTKLSDATSANPKVYPLSTTTYTATLQVPGCPAVLGDIAVQVDTLFFPEIPALDTTVCQNFPYQLAAEIQNSSHYLWSPPTGLSDSTSSGPFATPDQTTVYTLTATSANGYCTQTATVTLNIIPADVDILGDETREICLGDSVVLTASANPPGAVVNWQPGFYVNPTSGPTVTALPDESITVLATYSINGCLVYDSVDIRVDSLPDLAIVKDPQKDIYCPGDTIYLLSPIYEPASFPGMVQHWEPFGGQLTPVENWNMVIFATTTNTFRRITDNHACTDTAEVFVPVGVPPVIVATANPQDICPGESSQLSVTVNPDQAVEWEDPSGALSCTMCKTPTASPVQTTTFMVNTPDADCPMPTSVTVTVLPLPALDLSPKTICQGDSVMLNNIPTNPLDGYSWTAVAPGDPASIQDATVATPTVFPDVSTTYSVFAQGQQCANAGTVAVTVNSATIDAGAGQTVCAGDPVTLTATTTGTPGTIVWLPGPGTGPSITVTPAVSTNYIAILEFQPNCSVADVVPVTVVPGIRVDSLTIDPQESIICEGARVHLNAYATPSNVTFSWFENGVEIPGAVLDSLVIAPPGAEEPVPVTYSVVITNADGCTAGPESVELMVRRCFAIPNAFTPDHDGNNDEFGGIQILGGELEVVEFRVFSRWGQKVFEANGTKTTWDGTLDGKDAPSDVYVFYITVRFANGDEETFKGDVTLLR
ncbi:MAG: choice-of-anchor L domain-containing protein [Lewinellaceae bacterium]|nr:choice-of-anchor L domain-containing protein [Saprospiraceae bacterium]MCB9333707.1 choice-of-anchor L domain-containing protein [Lewinellaceae bacterium]